jgi:hypothetical protein
MLLHLVYTHKLLSLSACAGIFAAIDCTVIEFLQVTRMTVFGLHVPVKALLLRKSFKAPFLETLVWLFVRVSMLAVVTLDEYMNTQIWQRQD